MVFFNLSLIFRSLNFIKFSMSSFGLIGLDGKKNRTETSLISSMSAVTLKPFLLFSCLIQLLISSQTSTTIYH